MTQQMYGNAMYTTFHEGELNFTPTYRLFPMHDEWSNKREQTPSWTDRILYKSHLPVSINAYAGIYNCYGSDHRPVYASFSTEIRLWYVPEISYPLSDDHKFGIIEFKQATIIYKEETAATHIMLTFHSPYLEYKPKSSQIALNSEKVAEFDGDKLPMLSFIFANPDILKDLRLIIALHLLDVDGDDTIMGYTSIPLQNLINFIQNNFEVDYRLSLNTNLSEEVEADFELNSRYIGKIKGLWTYNICSRSEQYRF